MPRLTVVVPTYNRPDYLAECLESIAAQTYRDFDLVVLDNASTEDYAPVLKRFEGLGLTYIRNAENIGAIRNIEKARSIGSGAQYHAVFHDDDLMHPRMLEWQVEVLDGHPDMGWVATECVPFDSGSTPAFNSWEADASDLEVLRSPAELVRRLLENVSLNFGSVMFRSEVARTVEVRSAEFEIIADRVLLCDIAASSIVGFLRCPLVLYRHHAAQDSYNPIFREAHALALMAYYAATLPSPLSESDRALIERHATNYLLHARSMVPTGNRMRFKQLVGEAHAQGLFRWSALDGQGAAAIARLAGVGRAFDAVRPVLGRVRRTLSGS